MSFSRAALYLLLAFAIVVPVRIWLAQPFIVSGGSMEPTFAPGDYLVVDELTYQLHEPQRGDVVIFRYPRDPAQVFIKRVVALPGETVQVDGGIVSVVAKDGHTIALLDEPYRTAETAHGVSRTKLHDDEYYVLGDYRDASTDSRSWGPLQRRLLIGRAYLRLFPLTRFSYLPGEYRYAARI